MVNPFMWPFEHKHKWKTTHTNQWLHPTRQECECGVVRTFEWKPDKDEIIGMPWDKGEWVWSNGQKSEYSVLF